LQTKALKIKFHFHKISRLVILAILLAFPFKNYAVEIAWGQAHHLKAYLQAYLIDKQQQFSLP
jgi:hypothetical protein